MRKFILYVWIWINWPRLNKHCELTHSFWAWLRSADKSRALLVAFVWRETWQGFHFWYNIYRKHL